MMKSLVLVACVSIAGGCGEDPAVPVCLEPWLRAWEELRTCLMPEPHGDTATTLAIMTLDGRRADCQLPFAAVQMRTLATPGSTWRDAMATAAAIDPRTTRFARSVAIDRVDGEVAMLRVAFGALPPERRKRKAPRKLGPGKPLTIERTTITIETPLTLNAGSIAGQLRNADEIVEFTGTSLDHMRVYKRHPGEVVGYPDGATFEGALAAIDDGGIRIVIRPPRPNSRAAYTIETTSRTGPAFQSDREGGAMLGLIQWPDTGDLLIFVREPTGDSIDIYKSKLEGMVVNNWPVRFQAGCAGSWTAWSFADDRLVQNRNIWGGPSDRARDLLACGNKVPLLFTRNPDRIERCDRKGCLVVHEAPAGLRGYVAFHEATDWVYTAQVDDVIGVWRGNNAPLYYRLGQRGRLVGVVVLETLPHLVVVGADQVYRFIALPTEDL